MKVLLDIPRLQERPLGMQVYTEHVIGEILSNAPSGWEFAIQTIGLRGKRSHCQRLREMPAQQRIQSNYISMPQRLYDFLIRSNFGEVLSGLFEADLIHSFGWRSLPPIKSPVVLTIQDVIPLRLKEGDDKFIKQVHDTLTNLVRQATRIITISEFSKREIADVLAIDEHLIEVIPDGVDSHHFRPLIEEERGIAEKCLQRLAIRRPYFVHFGGFAARKNRQNLIKAFDLAKTRYQLPHSLVLVGSDSISAELAQLIASSKHRSQIVNTGYLPASDSLLVLQQADSLIFPSTYEGFGLPPLEAMACGVPVAMSNSTALPEVGGDACIYFDPLNIEEICDALKKISTDKDSRRQCIERGRLRSQTMTWQRNAKQTIALYCEVLRARL